MNNFLLVSQVISIFLWTWILLIMIKRVVCRGFDIRYSTVVNSLKTSNFSSITRAKFNRLISDHYYISDILLLICSAIAIIQFSNQFYNYATSPVTTEIRRKVIWTIFQFLLTGSILFKYKKFQPKLFTNIKQEIKYLFKKDC